MLINHLGLSQYIVCTAVCDIVWGLSVLIYALFEYLCAFMARKYHLYYTQGNANTTGFSYEYESDEKCEDEHKLPQTKRIANKRHTDYKREIGPTFLF